MPIKPVGGGKSNVQVKPYYDGKNYGSYAYISLTDVINNFIATYIGEGKLLQNTLRGDVHYHAHRGLQELSYDTLHSCKTLEVEVCPNLQVPVPHDYVNYVKITLSGENGIEQVLYPTSKTSNPKAYKQDDTQCTAEGDTSETYSYNKNNDLELDDSSDTWDKYKGQSSGSISVPTNNPQGNHPSIDADHVYQHIGQRHGLEPQHAQANGTFFIDCDKGMIHFSSNLSGKTIVLEYISDHHAQSEEMIVHKFAEEALYKWIAYGCASARMDIPEGVIQRLKRERFAEIRKAKIRLSNIKIEEIAQIMRGKSKFIKH